MGEQAPLRTEYNKMSVTSYEFLIITVFPKKEIRAEPSRAEGGSAAGGERGGRSVLGCGVSVCVRRIGRKIEYLPRGSPVIWVKLSHVKEFD